MTHGSVIVIREPLFVLLVAVQKEDRIVHGNAQLKDGYQSLRDVGNLSQKDVASHIIKDGNSDTEKEDEGNHNGGSGDLQNDKCQNSCDGYIDRQLLHTQVLDIGNDSCHTTDEALFIDHLTHLGQCLHGIVGRCGIVKKHQHHRGISVEEARS